MPGLHSKFNSTFASTRLLAHIVDLWQSLPMPKGFIYELGSRYCENQEARVERLSNGIQSLSPISVTPRLWPPTPVDMTPSELFHTGPFIFLVYVPPKLRSR